MTTDLRIREDAKLAWKNTITAYEDSDEIPFWEGYYTGAKSERNKTIDEAIKLIEKDFTYTTVVEKLKSLKVNP